MPVQSQRVLPVRSTSRLLFKEVQKKCSVSDFVFRYLWKKGLVGDLLQGNQVIEDAGCSLTLL